MLARNPFNYPTILHLDLLLSWSETSYQNILANDDRSAFFQAIKREDKIVREIHPRLFQIIQNKVMRRPALPK